MLVLKICDFLYTLAIFRSFPFIISNTYITPKTTFYRQTQAFPKVFNSIDFQLRQIFVWSTSCKE